MFLFSSLIQKHSRKTWIARIKLVNPKWNQSWIFIGRTDDEAEAAILWPPDMKNWLTGKDPDAGKDWRQEKKGMTEDGMVGWHHRLNRHGVWAGSRSCWWTGKPGMLQFMGLQRVRHDWATELNWTSLIVYIFYMLLSCLVLLHQNHKDVSFSKLFLTFRYIDTFIVV